MDFNRDNIVIDLETFGTMPDSVILSIGAVRINKDGFKDEFMINIDPNDSVRLGAVIYSETLDWWKKQKPEVLKQSLINAVSVEEAFSKFGEWYGKVSLPTWGNGANMDITIMEWHFVKLLEQKYPWNFWDVECYRTMAKVAPELKPTPDGDKHTALADAKVEAEHLLNIWNMMNG